MADTVHDTGPLVLGTRRDRLLDLVASVLLVLGLLLAPHVVTVRVAALTTALALLLPYAVRWEGLPLPGPAVSLVKALLAAPLAVLLVQWSAGFSGARLATDTPTSATSGLCFVALLSALGCTLLPRSGEDHPTARRGAAVLAVVLAGLAAVAFPAVLLLDVLLPDAGPHVGALPPTSTVALLLTPGAAVVALVVGTVRGVPGWRETAVVLGLTVLALTWLAGLDAAGQAGGAPRLLPDATAIALLVPALAATLAARGPRASLLPRLGLRPLPVARAAVIVMLVDTVARAAAVALAGASAGAALLPELLLRVLVAGCLTGALVLLRPDGTATWRRWLAAASALTPSVAGTLWLVLVTSRVPGMDATVAPLRLALTLGLGVLVLAAVHADRQTRGPSGYDARTDGPV